MSDELTYEELQQRVTDLTDGLEKAETFCRNFFENSHSIMLIIHPETGHILDANTTACEFYGYTKQELTKIRIMGINTLSEEQVRKEMQQAQRGKQKHFTFRHRLASGEIKDVEVFSGPITRDGEEVLYSIIHDISERKTHEQNRDQLIAKLEHALAEIKTLRGILPICASCKNIRDGAGNWTKIEAYICQHSEVDFTHGICPDCLSQLYPDLHVPDHE
jgi:PAS domain S-box-containing protein